MENKQDRSVSVKAEPSTHKTPEPPAPPPLPRAIPWKEEPWTIKAGFLLGILALLGDLVAAYFVTRDFHTVNYLLVILGGSLGYCVGVLNSPYTKDDAKHFSVIANAASAFLSGFVLAKADKLFDEGLKSGLFDINALGRFALFASAFVILAPISFVSRKYVGVPHPLNRL